MTIIHKHKACCFIRISMNNLKDIHNRQHEDGRTRWVVLSGFQWTIWRIYTTHSMAYIEKKELFYQDFNEQFEGYTQPFGFWYDVPNGCFIRISMNNLKDIHNLTRLINSSTKCCFIRISMNNLKDIHNSPCGLHYLRKLFYQDFNEQFEGYTQLAASL